MLSFFRWWIFLVECSILMELGMCNRASSARIDLGTTEPVKLATNDVPDLSVLVNRLMMQVNTLTEQRQKDSMLLKELEKRTVQNYRAISKLSANELQTKEHVSEIKVRLEALEEHADQTSLELSRVRLGQGEIKTDLAEWGKVKDNVKRSLRKINRKFERSIASLNVTAGNLTKQIAHLREECTNSSNSLAHQVLILNEKISNRSDGVKDRNSRFNSMVLKYTAIDKDSGKHQQDESTDTTEEGSGEVDGEFLTPPWQSKPEIDPGSGDGEPNHSKNYYLKIRDFIQEIKVRDLEISGLHDLYFDLEDQLEQMESRLTSIQLGHFMERLQQSLVNFTQNVITMDQWRTASSDIVNSTQLNQQQIQSLAHMILNNTNHLSDLEWKVTNVNSLSYQQFNVLRMHVIQLNNTVQDMKESLQKQKQGQGHRHSNIMGNYIPSQTNIDVVLSRLDDLGLQIVFNENRISKLEIQTLNKTLAECQKFNTDIYQDDRIIFLERTRKTMEEKIVKVQEMVRRLDSGVYKIFTMARNHSELITTLFTELSRLVDFVPFIIESKRETDNFKVHLPKDCEPYFQQGNTNSGVYIIHPINATQSVQVYCDMSGEDGGWTVIQRRSSQDLDFSKDWRDYVQGFGTITGDYWLGLQLLHLLTFKKPYSLKIEMVDITGALWVAYYDSFKILGEEENFKLEVSGYHGNSTDGLEYSNGMGFSTADRDNDASSTHCALYYLAGWWYKHCHYGNLNGRYDLGMVWYNFDRDEWLQLKSTAMKIKPQK